MIEELAGHGCTVLQLWGMTETSPLGTIATPTPAIAALAEPERADVLSQQGRVRWGLEARIVAEDGSEAPRDGKAQGALWVRGPWVAKGYFGGDADVLDEAGWFPTGDVATLDGHGYLRITDRTKDVIKSAANGSARSRSRTWPAACRAFARPPSSPPTIPNGKNVPC